MNVIVYSATEIHGNLTLKSLPTPMGKHSSPLILSSMGGGGSVRHPPLWFLPFTQKILRQPLPEYSRLLVEDPPIQTI